MGDLIPFPKREPPPERPEGCICPTGALAAVQPGCPVHGSRGSCSSSFVITNWSGVFDPRAWPDG